MSVELLARARAHLGDLVSELVFVGGSTVPLWVDDPAAGPARPTLDVDAVIEVDSRIEYYRLEERLRGCGFRNDIDLICRWRHRDDGLILDVMPTDSGLLGFSNRWQEEAYSHGVEVELEDGRGITAASPAALLACKFEAFSGRGSRDYLLSKDFADIVSLLDGCSTLEASIAEASEAIRRFLAEQTAGLLEWSDCRERIQTQLLPDAISQARAESVVIPRLREIAAA